jgi:hypothetical protein
MINENWVWQDWKFKAFTQDCNTLKPSRDEVDLIINTSTEHFDKLDWFNNLPDGVYVALQGADMKHDDHFHTFSSLEDFENTFKINDIYFSGEKEFVYPNWSFRRFMLIGIK